MTLVEIWVLSPVGPSLANPKSESLASYSYWIRLQYKNQNYERDKKMENSIFTPSRRILDAFKSLYITFESCKNSRPLAAPMAIFSRKDQERICEDPGNKHFWYELTAFRSYYIEIDIELSVKLTYFGIDGFPSFLLTWIRIPKVDYLHLNSIR